jgi:hypothetical protein
MSHQDSLPNPSHSFLPFPERLVLFRLFRNGASSGERKDVHPEGLLCNKTGIFYEKPKKIDSYFKTE